MRLTVAALALLAGAPQAVCQYYDPPEPGDPYAYERGLRDAPYDAADPYGDYDRPMRARPRRGPPPDERDYGGYAPDRPPGRAASTRRPTRLAALPPDADPAYSTALDFDDQVDPGVSTREVAEDPTGRPAGTITIDTKARKLYLSMGNGQAYQYGVGVGREGFAWKGEAQIGRKAYWPGWTPPREMLLRRPDLPDHMDGGLENPLGARALYLFKGARDTMFRIHGTNEPDTIGQAVSSGCIRMLNADVIDLYRRVPKGARVVVL
ncbi:L,D-transpeptidase [Methylocystis parvus]|uniref:L,D-transpeptidase family protein n=1 Tax=Methylocystis parvus TaxID=134 RepID=A0A6B8LXU5_9HYPH|nr:L,D-transpeptidase [Methylocystis parvus]QGM96274.1 L,D-transpeptidase family protein [Methylocystis parvus]WBJ99890.1 L,D-transpeptidase [Methylocystis parvus OBBP]